MPRHMARAALPARPPSCKDVKGCKPFADKDSKPFADKDASKLPAALFRQWDPAQFAFQETLPHATRTGCPIEIYVENWTGTTVAAKRFPCEQVSARLRARQRDGIGEFETAWPELVLTQRLGRAGLPGFCTCLGAFRDDHGDVLLVTEYIPGGDLLELAKKLGSAGPEREQRALPVIYSMLGTVLRLHSHGVAHCDISLENALRRADGEVVLIDFETSVASGAHRRTGVRGKPSYQAPEMHLRETWDAFAADLFACGVSVYCLAVGTYPWQSTKPGVCRRFAYYKTFGFQAFLRNYGLTEGSTASSSATGCISSYLAGLLAILLHPDPEARCLGMQSLLSPAQ